MTHGINIDALKKKDSTSSEADEIALTGQDLKPFYGEKQALNGINMTIPKKRVTAFIGPSGCGKSTLLRCFNRMNDLVDDVRIEGQILLHDKNIYHRDVDIAALRRQIGMVFQKPNPFPKTIYENIAYAPRIHGMVHDGPEMDELVESALRRASIWDEVKDKLQQPGTALSGGQQQRLCIARTIAVQPEVILMDEPTSALDPISTQGIEELVTELKEKVSIVIVTHNMQQAARVSDYTGFMYLGELIELGKTEELFVTPAERLTEEYITGKFG